MHILLLALAIIATFTPPTHAQRAATGIANDAARGSKTARLSVDALCAQLTLDEVTAIMGRNFERRPDGEQLFKECKYGDSTDIPAAGTIKVTGGGQIQVPDLNSPGTASFGFNAQSVGPIGYDPRAPVRSCASPAFACGRFPSPRIG